MRKTVYDALGLSPKASADLIEQAYQLAVAKLEPRIAHGDADARNELVAVKEAYRVLSSQERRSQYDSSIFETSSPEPVPVISYRGYDSFDRWWEGPKTTWLLVGLVAIGLAYAGQRYFVAHSDSGVRSNEIREGATTDRIRAGNEGRLVDGAVSNQAAEIANRAQVQNRVIGVAETAEQRRSRELDYRARSTDQQLEIQRQQQDAQLRMAQDRQNAALRQQERSAQERAEREDAARVEKERRYYSCMAATTNLTGDLDKAKLRCLSYR